MALTDTQLQLLDETKEVDIETRSERGAFETIIWIVVIDGVVYVRSVQGDQGRWYRRALANPQVAVLVDGERFEFQAVHIDDSEQIEAVTTALRDKYPPGGSLDRMTRDEVLGTTLRLEPT